MAYRDGRGWNDITELQCLLIMKKLVAEGFPHGMQIKLCKELDAELKKINNPLEWGSISAKVGNYKAVAKHNAPNHNSTNTRRLHDEYENHSVEELEIVIIEMQKKI